MPALLRARELTAPERFSFHSARMRMKRVTKEELAAMDADSDRCALELSDARVDVLGYACLVAIMSMGLGYHRVSERRLHLRTTENEGPAPVVMRLRERAEAAQRTVEGGAETEARDRGAEEEGGGRIQLHAGQTETEAQGQPRRTPGERESRRPLANKQNGHGTAQHHRGDKQAAHHRGIVSCDDAGQRRPERQVEAAERPLCGVDRQHLPQRCPGLRRDRDARPERAPRAGPSRGGLRQVQRRHDLHREDQYQQVEHQARGRGGELHQRAGAEGSGCHPDHGCNAAHE